MRRFLTSAAGVVRTSVIFRWYKFVILDSIAIIRQYGFKEFVRRRGWKVIAIVFLYYLIRDSILYILLPYLVAREIL